MLIYLHGFKSSPVSVKASELRRYMEARGFGAQYDCPQLPHRPAPAIALIENRIRTSATPVTLIGSSLGGYYATWLAEQHDLKAILVNPAVLAADSLSAYVGTQQNMYSGEQFEFTQTHIAEIAAIAVAQITEPSRYWLMVETGDEVLDYRLAMEKYGGRGRLCWRVATTASRDLPITFSKSSHSRDLPASFRYAEREYACVCVQRHRRRENCPCCGHKDAGSPPAARTRARRSRGYDPDWAQNS